MHSKMEGPTQTYTVIGLMSGTSLDGVDIAHCTFTLSKNRWTFNLNCAGTFSYPDEWKRKLASAQGLSSEDLALLHVTYGKYLGDLTNRFIRDKNLTAGLVASHGHTVFHRPETGLTLQIGSGAEIAAQTGITTVCDFRSQDVALGGQGAPLVPVGDKFLFDEYDFCLNLGGFSNISFEEAGLRKAFDICPVNIVLNRLAQSAGCDYDEDGKMAATGHVNNLLLAALNSLDFYQESAPKSLGREWLENVFMPVLDQFDIGTEDQLRTVVEHIAEQIFSVTKTQPGGKMLITGGGSKNSFLVGRISQLSRQNIVIPDATIIDFKEAIIFGFLGLLRIHSRVNCLASVTGAAGDHSSGAVYQGMADGREET